MADETTTAANNVPNNDAINALITKIQEWVTMATGIIEKIAKIINPGQHKYQPVNYK